MSGRLGPAITVLAVLVVVAKSASTQTVEPTNSAPNPYRAIYDWAKMPEGRTLGLDGRRRYRPGWNQRMGFRALWHFCAAVRAEAGGAFRL